MFNLEQVPQCNVPKLPKLFSIYLLLTALIFSSVIFAEAHPCENAGISLRGDLDVVSNKGGLWSLMEQRDLKDESVIGMQADGKLARAVGQFETLCEGEKKPEKQLFIAVQNLLGEARLIFNPSSSGEELTKSINKLIKNLDATLAKMK